MNATSSHTSAIHTKYVSMLPFLNEHSKRIWAAVEARSLGKGGVASVSKAIGMSRTTIYQGLKELEDGNIPEVQTRRSGAGRKKIVDKDRTIKNDLQALLEANTRGDPESPLLWTCKSTTKLAEELKKQKHKVSQPTVYRLLKEMGYSLQSNQKKLEGKQHPDRDKQFCHIIEKVRSFIERDMPVISVDTKKKELVGEYKNSGQEWSSKGCPMSVNTHDFPGEEGKVVPYGVYDVFANEGWVNVGINKDTAQFAVASIRSWWVNMGMLLYPEAAELLITADCGGSNSYRTRLWKVELQKLSNEIDLDISVCHFPPGTSKWNKIEHRLFCHITQNWRGRPLTTREAVVNLIGNTTTKEGLKVKAVLDESVYETGIVVTDEEMKSLRLIREEFHGEWNYQINSEKR